MKYINEVRKRELEFQISINYYLKMNINNDKCLYQNSRKY